MNSPVNISLIEPFFTGSHKSWATELVHHSNHNYQIFSLPGRYWKWRMHGGAISLARKFQESEFQSELILATDMLDLCNFLSLLRHDSSIPVALYFHENQLTYPWSETDKDVQQDRDNHYSFINYSSALTADHVFFNSEYHKKSFLSELPKFLNHFPDFTELETVEYIANKSSVLPLGLDLKKFDAFLEIFNNDTPYILWNHRWEYDKNPVDFFDALIELANQGLDFKLVVTGESFRKIPDEFITAREKLSDRLVHFGWVRNFSEYAKLLWQCDIIPITSSQDFFGVSLVEGVYCQCIPILPNRLAYPDHFPVNKFPEFYYSEKEDFKSKLAWAIENYKTIDRKQFSDRVARYDWSKQVGKYDKVLSEIAIGKYGNTI